MALLKPDLVNAADGALDGVDICSQIFPVTAGIPVRAGRLKTVVATVSIVVIDKLNGSGACREEVACRPS